MSEQYQISIGEEARALIERFKTPRGAYEAAALVMDEENQITVSNIQRLYLSFPKSGPTQAIGCRVQSNRLRASIRASTPRVVASGSGFAIDSSIGSNVKYAGVQECGYAGEVTVAPHVRKRTENAVVFGQRRKVRKADSEVRGHKRKLNIEGRGFIQRGVFDRVPDYGKAMSAAIVTFLGGAK
jgi:hypothetical protein